MKVSKKGDYGVRALVELAHHYGEGPIQSSQIASAQEVDARAALLASLKAMGGENLKTIEYSGAGFSSRIGQQYSVNGGWPTYEVADYTRSIDYETGWSRED